MNDRQTHIEHFERQTHRVCEINQHPSFKQKPFAPGVVTNARDLDSDDFRDLTPAETLFVYAAFVVFLVGLVGLVAMAVGWLSVVL